MSEALRLIHEYAAIRHEREVLARAERLRAEALLLTRGLPPEGRRPKRLGPRLPKHILRLIAAAEAPPH